MELHHTPTLPLRCPIYFVTDSKLSNVKNARLIDGAKVEMSEAPGGTLLRLPQTVRDTVDTVIVLDKVR